MTQKLRGIHNSVQHPSRELAANLVLVEHGKDTNDSHTEVLLLKKPAKGWLMGYHVQHPTHSHSTYWVFHGQHVHAAWDCLFLSDCGMLFQTHVCKVVSNLLINTDIPSME
jgi:hypothetical protein